MQETERIVEIGKDNLALPSWLILIPPLFLLMALIVLLMKIFCKKQ